MDEMISFWIGIKKQSNIFITMTNVFLSSVLLSGHFHSFLCMCLRSDRRHHCIYILLKRMSLINFESTANILIKSNIEYTQFIQKWNQTRWMIKKVFFSSHTVSNLLSGISFAPFNLTKKKCRQTDTKKNEFLFQKKKNMFHPFTTFWTLFSSIFQWPSAK